MRKYLFLLTSILWAISMVMLYKRESIPFKGLARAYKEFLPKDLVLREEWFGIYFNENKIGYANYRMGLDDVDAKAGYKVQSEAYIVIPILGMKERTWFKAWARIDNSYRLRDFNLSLFMGGIRTQISGERIGPNKFNLKLAQDGRSSSRVIELPEGIVFGGIFGPPKEIVSPEVGKVMRFFTLNPLTMVEEEVVMEVLRKEKIRIGDKLHDAYLIKAKFSGIESLAWVDRQGRLLKEETTLGIKIIKESQDKALSFISLKGRGFDLADFFSLESNEELEPKKIKKLVLVLKGKNLKPEALSSPRQEVIKVEEVNGVKWVYLVIHQEPREEELRDPSLYLKSDEFIQAQDERIRAIASDIVKGEVDDLSRARRIMQWVYNYLDKKPTLSVPSALSALQLRQGDCNEHTFLFTALSRSLGIPTKILNGLVYINGKFYYHSWPAVYAGNRWVELDPTLNQFPADPTHIKLIEGGLAQQIELLRLFGRIEVEVKDYE